MLMKWLFPFTNFKIFLLLKEEVEEERGDGGGGGKEGIACLFYGKEQYVVIGFYGWKLNTY